MKRLLTTLVILTGLFGSGGAVWAQDLNKGLKAAQSDDYATALKEWKPLAEQGHKIAQFNLGVMYSNGRWWKGITQDYVEAVKWYRKAAEQGYAGAQYNLGLMYYNGEGVTQDNAEAVKWWRKAAEQGFVAAKKWLKAAASAQNAEKERQSADYNNGLDAFKAGNKVEAVKWWRKAAEQGVPAAQTYLGWMYKNGKGVTQDYTEAVKWYRKAADQGYGDASDGLMKAESALRDRANEKIARANAKIAREKKKIAREKEQKLLFAEANRLADQGNAAAQYNLAFIYNYGNSDAGVTQDDAEAVKWYRKAAEQGHAQAQFSLGGAYYHAIGVTQDYAEAVKWYRKAAEQGHEGAQIMINSMEAKIALAQRQEATENTKRITKSQQTALERLGLYDGPIDGIAGPKTNRALKRWQTSRGYTGELSEQQTAELIDTAERYAAKRKEEERQAAKTQPQKEEPPTSFGTGSTGSGFFVSKLGHVVTNEHVVRNCGSVTVGDNANKQVSATVLETDKRNDLALLKLSSMAMASANTKSLIQKLGLLIVPLSSNGLLRSDDVELGERLMVGGYPYGDIFSNTIKVTGGMVSAIRGMGDDSGQFQMDAAVQPGNSGGPIYDENGNIVGVVVAQLNKMKVAKAIGSLPENQNFGIKASTVRQFLVSSGLPTKWSDRSERMSSRDIAKIAKNQTVMVVCGP